MTSPQTSLEPTEIQDRLPGPGEIRVKVGACGVCRTDLHVVDGELPDPKLPIIPGHEIVGRIDLVGFGVDTSDASGLRLGERVGIPWLGHTCGVCPYCQAHRENLCDRPLFTGFTRDGGFATSVIADARYAFPLGETGPGLWHDDAATAPLLCAGLIGWRALGMTGDHMSDIPSFAYRLLWEERQLLSVANLTRQDGLDFLRQAPGIGIVTTVTRYKLLQANEALADLRAGRFEGAGALIP